MPQFPVTHLVQNTLAGRCCTSAIFCFYLSLYTHIPFTPISQLSCLQKGLVHLEFNLLSSKLTQLSCTISANPSPPCCAHSAMGTDRQERGPPTKPSNPLFMDLHRFFFLESFHQGLLSSDHLNHCFAPHYRTYTVGNYCGIPRRQKSNRIVFLRKKNPIFSCQRNSFKMSSMLFSSQQLVFNSTFQITWMPTQNIWQRLDCWQVGCYSGNFEPDKKKN